MWQCQEGAATEGHPFYNDFKQRLGVVNVAMFSPSISSSDWESL